MHFLRLGYGTNNAWESDQLLQCTITLGYCGFFSRLIERSLAQDLGDKSDGTPRTRDALKQAWRDTYAKSKLTADLHFHDLRGAAVTMLAEAGCTVPEIATITGHTQAHA